MTWRSTSAFIASAFWLGLAGGTLLHPEMKGRDDYDDAHHEHRSKRRSYEPRGHKRDGGNHHAAQLRQVQAPENTRRTSNVTAIVNTAERPREDVMATAPPADPPDTSCRVPVLDRAPKDHPP